MTNCETNPPPNQGCIYKYAQTSGINNSLHKKEVDDIWILWTTPPPKKNRNTSSHPEISAGSLSNAEINTPTTRFARVWTHLHDKILCVIFSYFRGAIYSACDCEQEQIYGLWWTNFQASLTHRLRHHNKATVCKFASRQLLEELGLALGWNSVKPILNSFLWHHL